jgi:hypothetical protein
MDGRSVCEAPGCYRFALLRRDLCDRHETERLERAGREIIRRQGGRRSSCRCAAAGRRYCEMHREERG